MLRILLLLVALTFSTGALAENHHVPGCCIICKAELQACGNKCISRDNKCSLPIGMGCACDQVYLDKFLTNKAKCCKSKGGVCGCAGERVLCCDASLSDICACEFLLLDKTNPKLYTDKKDLPK